MPRELQELCSRGSHASWWCQDQNLCPALDIILQSQSFHDSGSRPCRISQDIPNLHTLAHLTWTSFRKTPVSPGRRPACWHSVLLLVPRVSLHPKNLTIVQGHVLPQKLTSFSLPFSGARALACPAFFLCHPLKWEMEATPQPWLLPEIPKSSFLWWCKAR